MTAIRTSVVVPPLIRVLHADFPKLIRAASLIKVTDQREAGLSSRESYELLFGGHFHGIFANAKSVGDRRGS